MNIINKLFVAAALASASMSAHAIEAHIKVWADVDPTLSLLKADGSALDDMVEMSYRAGAATGSSAGLTPWTQMVRIFSNDTAKDVRVRVGSAAALSPEIAGPGAIPVPLTVSLKGVDLAVLAKDFTKDELYAGGLPGASIEMPLTIRQTTQGAIAAAGKYVGIVSVIVEQKP